MPRAIKRHKVPTLQPRVKALDMSLPIKKLTDHKRTLKQRKGNRTLALNNAAWRRLRESVLAEEPLCRRCAEEGRFVPATDVDHSDNDPGNNNRENLVALCHSCHSIKTNEDRYGPKVRGCDVNGWPIDPRHPWYRDDE